MTWLRLDDGADTEPALLAIARTRGEADRFLGILTALKLYCARHLTDGYLPTLIVAEHIRSAGMLLKFTRPVIGAPLLHVRGDECECLPRGWPGGFDFAVHGYLTTNPTKTEHDVARAKAAELRDRELLAAVRRRDRDRCRYCAQATTAADRRSARGLVYDHIDPALAAGAANLVVACRGCNSRKGKRTPDAAGMALLPAPGEHTAGADPAHELARELAPINGSEPDATTRPRGTGRDGTGPAGAGAAGPDGQRELTGPAPPRPRSVAPDPYRRAALTGIHPDTHAGLPEEYPPPDGGG